SEGHTMEWCQPYQLEGQSTTLAKLLDPKLTCKPHLPKNQNPDLSYCQCHQEEQSPLTGFCEALEMFPTHPFTCLRLSLAPAFSLKCVLSLECPRNPDSWRGQLTVGLKLRGVKDQRMSSVCTASEPDRAESSSINAKTTRSEVKPEAEKGALSVQPVEHVLTHSPRPSDTPPPSGPTPAHELRSTPRHSGFSLRDFDSMRTSGFLFDCALLSRVSLHLGDIADVSFCGCSYYKTMLQYNLFMYNYAFPVFV
ncbi:hypothetical protein STEG23_012876, partial [Scotinomys teguina]